MATKRQNRKVLKFKVEFQINVPAFKDAKLNERMKERAKRDMMGVLREAIGNQAIIRFLG